MMETVESVKSFGVLQPAIVRPTKDGEYEILKDALRTLDDVKNLG